VEEKNSKQGGCVPFWVAPAKSEGGEQFHRISWEEKDEREIRREVY